MQELPVRGDVRGTGLPVPPDRMPALHRRQPLKRWHYVGIYRPDVMLCIVSARVAGIPQRWWAAALPDGSLSQGRRGVHVDARHARVRGVVELELSPPPDGVQVVSPHGRSYVWTMKSAPVHV